MSATDSIDPDFEALLAFLKQNRNFDVTGYKRASLMRRVDRQMQNVGIETYSEYLDYLEVHPAEFTALFDTILINVTGFFRDPSSWSYIAETVIPMILASKPDGAPIRVWSAGCASGEEAYTAAILLAETLGADAFRDRVKIYATDLDEDALNTARQAVYPPKQVSGIPSELLEKYFEPCDKGYLFRKDLRRSVIFGRHDLIHNAPISRIDLLICRNVLMYFNVEAQARILASFHYALNEKGFLFLGRAEMLFMHTRAFAPVELKKRVFARTPRLGMRDRLLFIAQEDGDGEHRHDLDTRLRNKAFDAAPIAQLVIDIAGNIVLANDRARRLLTFNDNDVGRPLRDFEFSFRPVDLRSMVESVRSDRRPITEKLVEWRVDPDLPRWFDIHVSPIHDGPNGALLGSTISYIEVTAYKGLQQELHHAHQELEVAYEELQSTNEELETTNEELQSTVEELETTNEELQSTNEELETMNEELQSTNEELETINEELQKRGEELNQVNAFLESILISLQTAVVVINREMRVHVWNPRAEEMWGLRSAEVQGEYFANLDFGLPIPALLPAIRACIAGDTPFHQETMEATNRRGRPIVCRIVSTPLQGEDGMTHGAILLMETVTQNEVESTQ